MPTAAFVPSVIPTLTTTIPLVLTATAFKSFATPAITVAFPSAYDQTQIIFAYTDTATYAATRVPSIIGGGTATEVPTSIIPFPTASTVSKPAASTAASAAGTASKSSALPLWAIATIAAAGFAAIVIFAVGLFCWCKRKKTTQRKQAARKNRGNAKIAAAFAEKHALDAEDERNKHGNGPAQGGPLSGGGGGGGQNAAPSGGWNAARLGNGTGIMGVKSNYFGVSGIAPPSPTSNNNNSSGNYPRRPQNTAQHQQQQQQQRFNNNAPSSSSTSSSSAAGQQHYGSNMGAPIAAPIAFEIRRPDSPQRGPHVPFTEYDAYGQAIPAVDTSHLRRPRSYSSSMMDNAPSYATSLDGSPAPLLKMASNDDASSMNNGSGRRADQDLGLGSGGQPNWAEHNRVLQEHGGNERERGRSESPFLLNSSTSSEHRLLDYEPTTVRGGGGIGRVRAGSHGRGGGEVIEFGRPIESTDYDHQQQQFDGDRRPALRGVRSADNVRLQQEAESNAANNAGRSNNGINKDSARWNEVVRSQERQERRRSAVPISVSVGAALASGTGKGHRRNYNGSGGLLVDDDRLRSQSQPRSNASDMTNNFVQQQRQQQQQQQHSNAATRRPPPPEEYSNANNSSGNGDRRPRGPRARPTSGADLGQEGMDDYSASRGW